MFRPTRLNMRISMSALAWVGAVLLWGYCHISLFKLLSFWTNPTICEMSLWKVEIKALFFQNIMSTVWVDEGKEGTKGPLVVHGV